MAGRNSTTGRPIPAALYLRRSSDHQERSIPEQRADAKALAKKHGLQFADEYIDDSISGDNRAKRLAWQRLLRDAEAGKFSVVVAWHTNRLTREQPLDALEDYNKLRKAGCAAVITVCEGRMDLDDFAKQLLLFVGAKGNSDFLDELSRKVCRAHLVNAKLGRRNGAARPYGYERAEFAPSGELLRVLRPGDRAARGSYVGLVPTSDKGKLAAVDFMFRRFAGADLSLRQLARELTVRGFPSPRGKGWRCGGVGAILKNPAYCGKSRWADTTTGEHWAIRGGAVEQVERTISNGSGNGRKVQRFAGNAILVDEAHEALVPVKVWQRVQKKLAKMETRRRGRKAEFALAGLLYCTCGSRMHGHTIEAKDRRGKKRFSYLRYTCSSYNDDRIPKADRHGHAWVRADQLHRALANKLRMAFVGDRSRAELVKAIHRQLSREQKSGGAETDRLRAQLDKADREVARLVKAIRTLDAPELIQELAAVRSEREAVAGELQRVGRLAGTVDPAVEAERVASEAWALDEALADADPAVVREFFGRVFTRLECRFDHSSGKPEFAGCRGKVVNCDLLLCLSEMNTTTRRNGR